MSNFVGIESLLDFYGSKWTCVAVIDSKYSQRLLQVYLIPVLLIVISLVVSTSACAYKKRPSQKSDKRRITVDKSMKSTDEDKMGTVRSTEGITNTITTDAVKTELKSSSPPNSERKGDEDGKRSRSKSKNRKRSKEKTKKESSSKKKRKTSSKHSKSKDKGGKKGDSGKKRHNLDVLKTTPSDGSNSDPRRGAKKHPITHHVDIKHDLHPTATSDMHEERSPGRRNSSRRTMTEVFDRKPDPDGGTRPEGESDAKPRLSQRDKEMSSKVDNYDDKRLNTADSEGKGSRHPSKLLVPSSDQPSTTAYDDFAGPKTRDEEGRAREADRLKGDKRKETRTKDRFWDEDQKGDQLIQLKPRAFTKGAKEKQIARGSKAGRHEYKTMDDVDSDWGDESNKSNKRRVKKNDAGNKDKADPSSKPKDAMINHESGPQTLTTTVIKASSKDEPRQTTTQFDNKQTGTVSAQDRKPDRKHDGKDAEHTTLFDNKDTRSVEPVDEGRQSKHSRRGKERSQKISKSRPTREMWANEGEQTTAGSRTNEARKNAKLHQTGAHKRETNTKINGKSGAKPDGLKTDKTGAKISNDKVNDEQDPCDLDLKRIESQTTQSLSSLILSHGEYSEVNIQLRETQASEVDSDDDRKQPPEDGKDSHSSWLHNGPETPRRGTPVGASVDNELS